MKLYLSLFLILILISSKTLFSQNIVPNGGFEQLSECPEDISQTSFLIDWINPSSLATPDVYNSCSEAKCLVNVPSTFWGYDIESNQGEGFIGCAVGIKDDEYDFDLYKEYLYVKLENKLVEGQSYSFEVSLRRPPTTKIAVSFQAALLSEEVKQENIQNLALDPNLISTEAITNLNWEKYSSTYIANGDEEFLIIGNFETDYELFFTSISELEVEEDTCQIYDTEELKKYMYLLIDDISLEQTEIMKIDGSLDKVKLKINTDNNLGIQISLENGEQNQISNVRLFNQNGMLLYSSNDYKEGDWIDLRQLNMNIIFATVQIDGQVLVKKIFIN